MAILHLKDIFGIIREEGGLKKLGNIHDYMHSKYNLNFEKYTFAEINQEFLNFLHNLMEIYSDAKERIIMPQTKVLDFITRMKMSEEMQNTENYISFDSLMLLIAKDRKRIKNIEQKIEPLLGS